MFGAVRRSLQPRHSRMGLAKRAREVRRFFGFLNFAVSLKRARGHTFVDPR